VAGDTLLHADLRADNILIIDHGAIVVDWPWACRGAAFTDLVLFAPSVTMQGGLQPADLLASSRSGRAADSPAVAALVCALAGYLTQRSLQPPPPDCRRCAPSKPRKPPSPANGSPHSSNRHPTQHATRRRVPQWRSLHHRGRQNRHYA
jgi:hypothetical protein